MQYKSLFCIKGRDNWLRFSIISSSLYLVLLLGFVVMGAGGGVVLLALLLAPVLGLSTLRRLRDIQHRRRFVGLTLFPFVLLSLSLAYSGSAVASLTCVVIGSLLTFLLAIQQAIPSSTTVYHQGYCGPAFTSEKIKSHSRVEPTFNGSVAAGEEVMFDNQERISLKEPATDFTQVSAEVVTFDLWLIWAKENRILLLSVIGGILCLMVLSSLWSIFSPSAKTNDVAQGSVTSISQVVSDRDEVKLADGFSLLLEDEVLIMSWLGESREAGIIWSLATAKGDKSCSNLVFNNGSKYRPVLVELMPDTSIEARFTPLDTQEIISNIARREGVKVCGYDFSLKGSQSALAKSEAFTRYL